MRREIIAPRADWQRKVEADGLVWHTGPDGPYWNESAVYRFSLGEVDEIEAATAELYRLFLEAGQAIVDDPAGLDVFQIPRHLHQTIREAWSDEPPALNHGRFDLGFDGNGPPKLFEFNCDTPTSLIEASVIQWAWKEDVFPDADQFNSIHEKLVARWREIGPRLPGVHFGHIADDAGEDTMTVTYLRDTAEAAGIRTSPILMEDIGWDSGTRRFVDLDEKPIRALFKLYPWEWLSREAFGENLPRSLADGTVWMEPIWKMIWSNKAILPVLWSMFPDHPNLLPASLTRPDYDHIRKPILAREGANIEIVRVNRSVQRSRGDYGAEGYVHQALYALPEMAPDTFPVIGSWVVDGAPAGMGIREDGLITGNLSRFVPHVID